jgi:Mg-chelatase subunit ChlD
MRFTQEQVEVALPKSAIVQVIDQAEPEAAKRETLLGRLKGALGSESVSVARLKVERDASDIGGGLKDNSGGGQGFDPYWVQDQFETIKSKPVLSKVADELKLNEAWAEKKGGGRKLSPEETYQLLKQKVEVRQEKNSSLMDIRVKSEDPQEAARIANTIAKVYQDSRLEARRESSQRGIETLRQQFAEHDRKLGETREKLERLKKEQAPEQVAPSKPLAAGAAIPQPEVQTAENAFSTFSLNVSDVSFKLAAASLEKGVMPDAASVRSEEFINAFDYRDPEPTGSAPIAFAWERSRYPFAHDRDLLRFSVKTASSGRVASQPLNLVLLLDNSGSMERADRVSIRMECLRVLASQLKPQDRVSVVAFARTARLWVDGLPGNQAAELPQRVGNLSPEGGTNLEEAMNLAYQTALKHYLANGANRVVLLTDGAANLGDVKPESLKAKVEANRKQGIALDCFGIGWDGYNDDLLEVLSRNGDGRYGFVNTPEAASTEFAAQLAGALKVAASDVKVQVEWNPRRVTAYRQIGYAKHQLKKEQFRDNTVDAAEIGAAEAGNALYAVQVNPAGEGSLGTVRVRFKVPGTTDYREHAWEVPYSGAAKSLEQSSAAVRLAATASAFSEWLVSSPYAAEVTPDGLLGYLRGVPESCGADPRPKKLEWMIRQAKSLSGR